MVAPQTPFIGRMAELGRLDASIDIARSGSLRLAVIGGEAGVGKTRLLDEFLAGCSDELLLRGSCLPYETASLPYAPFVEALRALARSHEPRTLASALGGARAELARLIPELVPGPQPERPATSADPATQARLFEGILGLLERLARAAPVVLALEDVQWADPGTRDLLRFTVGNLRRSRALVVLTVRSGDLPDGPIVALLDELERLAFTDRIDLPRLSRSEVAAFLLALTGTRPTDATVDRLFARSDGNPFFVEQLVAAGEAQPGVPARLADTLRARLSDLSDATRSVLRATSVAARPVDDELIEAVTGLGADVVEAALREAVAARILVTADPLAQGRDGGYTFRHALLREVVDDELHSAQRRRLHHAVATALDARARLRTVGAPVAASELAFHWEAAEAWSEAIASHLQAGSDAAEVYAWGAAVHHYDRALELIDRDAGPAPGGLDRAELLHRAAEAAFLATDYPRAIAWGTAAIEAVAPTDPRRAGGYQVRLRWYRWDAGDRPGAVAALQEALRLLPPDPPSVERASALAQWSGALLHMGRPEEAAAAAGEALVVARAVGARADEAQALAMLGWIDVATGRPESGFRAMRDGVALAEVAGDVSGIALGHALIAHMHAMLDQPSEALAAGLDGYEAVNRVGVVRTYGAVLLGHATKALIELGDWDEADRLVELGFEQELVDRPAHLLRIQRGRLATLRGTRDTAARDLAAARAFEVASGGSEYGDDLVAAEVELAAWAGDVAAARAAFDTVLGRPLGMPESPPVAWAAAHAVRAEADEAGRGRARGDVARERMAVQRALAAVERLPSTAPMAIRLQAEAELGRAQDASDPARWQAVAEAWASAGRPYHSAVARYREAEALLAGGRDRASAAAALAAAQPSVARLRAGALEQEIARLARRARLALPRAAPGTEPERPVSRGPERLTGREAEVLRLIAGGWTNRQIAGELFISPRTAAVHVTNLLGKLGANSRLEAAAIAHRLGLVSDPPPPPDAVVAPASADRP